MVVILKPPVHSNNFFCTDIDKNGISKGLYWSFLDAK